MAENFFDKMLSVIIKYSLFGCLFAPFQLFKSHLKYVAPHTLILPVTSWKTISRRSERAPPSTRSSLWWGRGEWVSEWVIKRASPEPREPRGNSGQQAAVLLLHPVTPSWDVSKKIGRHVPREPQRLPGPAVAFEHSGGARLLGVKFFVGPLKSEIFYRCWCQTECMYTHTHTQYLQEYLQRCIKVTPPLPNMAVVLCKVNNSMHRWKALPSHQHAAHQVAQKKKTSALCI